MVGCSNVQSAQEDSDSFDKELEFYGLLDLDQEGEVFKFKLIILEQVLGFENSVIKV